MELKPCPFCGGEAEFWYKHTGKNWFNGQPSTGYSSWGTSKDPVKIQCRKCHANMEYSRKDIAIKAWNRRANEEPIR